MYHLSNQGHRQETTETKSKLPTLAADRRELFGFSERTSIEFPFAHKQTYLLMRVYYLQAYNHIELTMILQLQIWKHTSNKKNLGK